jgi:hypothetical protein
MRVFDGEEISIFAVDTVKGHCEPIRKKGCATGESSKNWLDCDTATG